MTNDFLNQPNILFIQADQWTANAGGKAYGNNEVITPNINKLADSGVVFENFYCNSPLCAPARFSMMSGQLPSKIRAYDNASEFSSTTPTFAHHLRHLGYQTCLSGKMHFIGADQLHGFERRLTTDIYPGDFGWTVNWDEPDDRIDWWYHNMLSVKQAGIAEITNQLEYDDDVGNQAVKQLYEFARGRDARPFAMTVSFTHPHDPYATRQKYWDMYEGVDISFPTVPPIPFDKKDPHSQRIHKACAMDDLDITKEDILKARRAYYGNITYIDDWVGKLIQVLEETNQRDNTIIVLASDHGDMLGERGLWYKMSFYEGSCRIPLIVSSPKHFNPARISNNTSLMDLLPTFVDIAGGKTPPTPHDGRSLVPLLKGILEGDVDEVIGEYMGEGSIAPIFMIRRGQYKYIWCESDPTQLYDLKNDPNELTNLSGTADFADIESAFEAEVHQRWDVKTLKAEIIEDQRQRHFIAHVLTIGDYHSWDYQPKMDASRQFMRNHLDLNDLEETARYPAPRKYDQTH